MSSDERCLFGCMSLKTGSNVIAILGITSTLFFLIAELITLLLIVPLIVSNDEIPAFFSFYESFKIHRFSLFNPLNVLVGILCVVNCLLLLFGISKKKHAVLLIWLIINLLILLVSHIIILANSTQRGIL